MRAAVVIFACLIGIASARIVQKSTDDNQVAAEVCYEHYGCFSTGSPWTSLIRPIAATPKPPYEVGTRFILFSRGTRDSFGYELLPDKDAILKFSDFKPERKTYFLIHGFTDNHRVEWIADTKDLLLKNEDVNIISVDWAPGAKSPYLQATANARLCGAQIARMITYLEQKGEMNINDVHVISHSLGSHVAGYAGDRLMGRIPRITAIDPMDLYFSGTDPIVRLDTLDTKYLEVIHSNSHLLSNLGLGISEAIGHVDIYPNGGATQPGCKDTLGNLIKSIIDLIRLDFEGAISTWACSHVRAAHYFAESISNADTCPYVSFECSNYNDYKRGNCYQACNNGKCTSLGYNAKRQPQTNGVYYLQTTDGANGASYCNQVVQIQASIGLSQKQTSGSLMVSFLGPDGSLSDAYTVIDSSRMSAGQIITMWVEVPSSVFRSADVRPSLVLRYKRGLLQPKTLEIDNANLVVIKPDLTTLSIPYNGVTLEAGTDATIT